MTTNKYPKPSTLIITLFSLLFLIGCQTAQRRKEAALKEDLYRMRTAIDQYSQGKSAAPQHLTDLASAGYLRAIPIDPFTNPTTTWVEVYEDATDSIDGTHPGMSDVHSSSIQVSSEGTRYDSW
jgi:general secretion pathway protein G